MALFDLLPPEVEPEVEIPTSDFEQTIEESLPPTAPAQPEAPQLTPDIQADMAAQFAPAEANAPGFANWAALQSAPKEEAPGDFSSFMERQVDPQVQPFDVKTEQKVYEESPVPDEVSQPDLQAQEQARLASLDPVEFQQEQARKQFEADQHAVQLRADEENRIAAEQERAATDVKTAIAKTRADMVALRARADEIAKRPEEGFFDNLDDSRNVGSLIKAIAIGFISPLHGLIALNGAFEANITRQKEQAQFDINLLGKQAGLLGEELAIHGDMFKAEQAVALAWKQKLPSMISAEMAKYDKAGSTAMNLETARRKAMADAYQAQAQAEKDSLKFELDKAELAKRQGEEFRAQAKFKRDMAPKAGAQRFPASHWNALYPGLNVPEGAMLSDKEVGAYIGRRKDVQDLTGEKPKTATERLAEKNLEQEERADTILSPFNQQPIGKPISAEPKAREITSTKIESHANLRTEAGRLFDFIRKRPREAKLLDRWKSDNRSKVETMRRQLAETYAKAVDPVGAISDKAIDAAMAVLPDVDGFTERKNPGAVYEVMVKTADDRIENHAKGAIQGYQPGTLTSPYQQNDAVLFAPGLAPTKSPTSGTSDFILNNVLGTEQSGLETFEDAEGKTHNVVESVTPGGSA